MNIITNQFRFVTPKTIMLIFKKVMECNSWITKPQLSHIETKQVIPLKYKS